MLAGIVLLLLHLHLQDEFFAPDAVECVVISLVQGQLALVQMQDGTNRVIEQVAIMADDQNRVAIGADIVLEPDHTFQIEIVGRFIQQQHVRFGKQGCSKRNTHPPATGKCRAWFVLRSIIETEPGQNGSRARCCGMGVNIGKTHLDVGNAVRICCRFCFGKQAGTLLVGCQDDFDEGFRSARCFLGHGADARIARHRACSRLGRYLAKDQFQQGRLAGAVAPDKTDSMAGGQGNGGVVDQQASFDAICQCIDMKHAGYVAIVD